jgi:DNA invertase Pin-like site-specific DNA recombinase
MTIREAVPQRAAVYARISDDREGRGLGVTRQENECRALAERLGWQVAEPHIYSDNDLSAYSGRPRPGYKALLAAIDRGEVDGLVAWHNDRLHRQQRELEDFIDLVDRTGIPIITVTAGAFDLATASGRMTARILGAVARQESEHKAERQRAKHAELAAQGAPSGGTRPFGLTDVKRGTDGRSYREEVPEEAEAIREAAKDLIAGTSIKAVCRRWEAQGLRGTRGRPFSPQVISTIMTAEWVVGRRAGRPAQWPAIVDEETWRLVGAVIRGRATGHGYARTLLSGIATCALCGHTLASRPKATGKPGYVCARDLGGCGKIVIRAPDFEQDVLERLFSRIDPEQLHDEPDDDEVAKAMAELARLEGVKTRLAELAGTGELDIAEFRAARAANDRAMRVLQETMARSAEDEALQRVRAEAVDLRAKWDDLDIDRRRQVVPALAERIEVGLALKGRNFYSPDRVKVTYR